VLLGNDEDVDHVDQRETGEGPSETHDTLQVSWRASGSDFERTYSGDTGALGDKRVSGAVVRVSLLVEDGSGNDGSWR
jgi:hypothetical protein